MVGIVRSIVFSDMELSCIIRALVEYYNVAEEYMPDVTMRLVSRLTAEYKSMIEDLVEQGLYNKK